MFRTLLMLVSLALPTREAYNKVEMMIKGVKQVNPCNDMALGALLPSVDQGNHFSGQESKEEVRQICPSLKFSCCSGEHVNTLVQELRDSFSYLRYRVQVIKKLFKKINEIAGETFNVFLNELTDADATCYNALSHKRLERYSEVFSENQSMLAALKERLEARVYDKEKMLADFRHLKTVIMPYIAELQQGNRDKEFYYAGFVCTMCSPMFTKHFRLEKDRPVMQVNKFFCKRNVQSQIKTLKVVEIYKYLQKFLDIVFCARKNSKSELDFQGVEARELEMLPSPVEMYQDLINERVYCVNDVDRFVSPPKKDNPDCRRICNDSMRLFEQNFIVLNKVIKAENEISNMFLRPSEKEVSVEERLEAKLRNYRDTRQKYIDMGLITMPLPEKNTTEVVSILKQKSTSKFRFTEVQVEPTNFTGVNIFHTPMTPSVYAFASRWALLHGLALILYVMYVN